MATVADIIKRSLLSIKAIDREETPSATEYADYIKTLNGMLKSWSAAPFNLYAPNQVTKVLTVGDTSQTIGSGADIDTTRPKSIVSAYLRDSGNTDYPLKVRSIEEYAGVVLKTVSGKPDIIYVRKGYPNWTIYFDKAVDEAFTLYLELNQPLSTYTAETDTFTAPDEYEDAVVYNLAIRLQPEHVISKEFQVVSGLAQNALSILKRANAHPVPTASICMPGKRQRSDIYEG